MHLIVYVINKKKYDLYDIILKNSDKFSSHSLYYNDMGADPGYSTFEGVFNGEEITIDFDGEINFIKLFIKYGQFLNHKSYYEKVINFEKKFVTIFDDQVDLYRIDEILLNEVVIDYGEFWYRKENACEIFESCILNEEKLHWLKLDRPYVTISYEDFLRR
jgi:hypothetical protein